MFCFVFSLHHANPSSFSSLKKPSQAISKPIRGANENANKVCLRIIITKSSSEAANHGKNPYCSSWCRCISTSSHPHRGHWMLIEIRKPKTPRMQSIHDSIFVQGPSRLGCIFCFFSSFFFFPSFQLSPSFSRLESLEKRRKKKIQLSL